MFRNDERDTRIIRSGRPDEPDRSDCVQILRQIYTALEERGYDPVQQLAHYLLTGEPAYITAHRNARALTAHLERDEVIEEIVRFYVRNHPSMKQL
ncbi:MAG: IreB family regulatory phosphoprotein [Bacillota bacterium]